MNFGEAVTAMRLGHRMTRTEWPVGTFVYLVPETSESAHTVDALVDVYPEGAVITIREHLRICQASGLHITFNPGPDSILAEDWVESFDIPVITNDTP